MEIHSKILLMTDFKDHFNITELFDIKTFNKSPEEYRLFVLTNIRRNLERYLPK
jgi:hypothetical protein